MIAGSSAPRCSWAGDRTKEACAAASRAPVSSVATFEGVGGEVPGALALAVRSRSRPGGWGTDAGTLVEGELSIQPSHADLREVTDAFCGESALFVLGSLTADPQAEAQFFRGVGDVLRGDL